MTAQLAVEWSAAPLLFGDDVAGCLHAALADPQRWPEVEARLGAVGSRLIGQMRTELASVAAQFTDVDLAKVLVTGWEKHRELRAAGRRSLADGEAVPVTLASHDVKLIRHPTVEVLVGERPVLTIECEFSAVLTVEGLQAIVRGGALREFKAGSCTIAVTFAIEGVELAKKEIKGRSIVGIPLGRGIPLAIPTPQDK